MAAFATGVSTGAATALPHGVVKRYADQPSARN
jgi:uncharacterized membrane protein